MVFPYAGSKGRVHAYPPPKHDLVIEPFCGSARYAVRHCRGRQVWLNDIDPTVASIWRYLQEVSRERVQEIFRDELYPPGTRLDDLRGLSLAERDLFSHCFSVGRQGRTRTSMSSARRRIDHLRRAILAHLDAIRGWTISCGSYTSLPDVEATWFVDPPYQFARSRYRYDCVINYADLGRWCRSRPGQVIVCEGVGASWLPFWSIGSFAGTTNLLMTERAWTQG